MVEGPFRWQVSENDVPCRCGCVEVRLRSLIPPCRLWLALAVSSFRRPLLIWSSFISFGFIRDFVFAAMTGSPHLYTVIQLWTVWDCFLGCICTSASGALLYDCLPSDENGRPLAASRDFNLLNCECATLLLPSFLEKPHAAGWWALLR